MTALEDALRQTFDAEVDGSADRMLSDVRRGARRRRTARTTMAVVAATAVVVAGVAVGGSLFTSDDAPPSPAPQPTETVTDPAPTSGLTSVLAVEAAGDVLYLTADDAGCDCSVLYQRRADKLQELHRFPVPFVDRLSFTPDGDNGWASAAGQVWATHDTGRTWVKLDLPPEAPQGVGDSYLLDSSAEYVWMVNLGAGSFWRWPVESDAFTHKDVPDTDGIQDVVVVGDSVVVEPRPTGEGNTTSVPRFSTDHGISWQELNWPCSGEHRLLPTNGAIFMTCEGVGEPEATVYRWAVGDDYFVGFANPAAVSGAIPLSEDSVLVPGADPALVTQQGASPAVTGLTADASIWDAAQVGDLLYLATTEGLLESTDDGRTWHRI